jgi:hypothetical protein
LPSPAHRLPSTLSRALARDSAAHGAPAVSGDSFGTFLLQTSVPSHMSCLCRLFCAEGGAAYQSSEFAAGPTRRTLDHPH